MFNILKWFRKFRQGRRSLSKDCEMADGENQKPEKTGEKTPERKIKIEVELDEMINRTNGLRIGDQIASRRQIPPANPEVIW